MIDKSTLDACLAAIDKLRSDHFKMAHTDMVGDDDERRGYLMGLRDCKKAIKSIADHPRPRSE